MIKSAFRMRPSAKLLIASAIGLTLVGCNKAVSEVTTPVVTPVKLMEVPDVTLSQVDSFIAKIDATDRAALSFQVAGEIESLNVKMGSMVEKGDVLAILDPNDYQLALDARQAEYSLAKTAFNRADQLYSKKLISTDDFDQTETQYKAAKAAYEQAVTDLNYTRITAPFDGVVSITFAKEHQVVGANQPILNLVDNSVMDVVFTVPVTYTEQYGLDKFSASTLTVSMDSHRDVDIPSEFKEISTQPDVDTNSYSASVTIQRPQELNLLPGMTGQVHLVNDEKKATIKIAPSAWISKHDTTGLLYRFNSENQTIQQIQVTLDENGDVISGLEKGDLIVEAGVDKLASGQQVKAWIKEGGI
ncbi:efflux RND transporter periplasmic adaptor subunit [Vibrio coralliilyticus]|uniref:efflux RND transporter periplasmic adaptor subunit n=1 Tax=Vibrio coralliilyticus TaxID=190893 RepID=UPI00155F6996|nr:efflux RND transporter periplasmic adaptor subunit [Vibrio coralliilyticus]NRF60805.1 efflux RND transporter periplasmic adaptor subunit [Vibrio coralliilyticus]